MEASSSSSLRGAAANHLRRSDDHLNPSSLIGKRYDLDQEAGAGVGRSGDISESKASRVRSLKEITLVPVIANVKEQIGKILNDLRNANVRCTLTPAWVRELAEILNSVLDVDPDLDVARFIHNACCEHLAMLTRLQCQRLCEVVSAAKVRYITTAEAKVVHVENEARINRLQIQILQGVRRASLLGHFAAWIGVDCQSLDQATLSQLHFNINNTKEADFFVTKLDTPKTSDIRSELLEFFASVNNFVLRDCLLKVQQHCDYLRDPSPNTPRSDQEEEELNHALRRGISFNIDYCMSFMSHSTKSLKQSALRFLSKLVESDISTSYLNYISNRGLINIVYFINELIQGPSITTAIRNLPRRLDYGDIIDRCHTNICKRAQQHSKNVAELNRLIQSLRNSTSLKSDIHKWRELQLAYSVITDYDSLCEAQNVARQWKRITGSKHVPKEIAEASDTLSAAFAEQGDVRQRVRALFIDRMRVYAANRAAEADASDLQFMYAFGRILKID